MNIPNRFEENLTKGKISLGCIVTMSDLTVSELANRRTFRNESYEYHTNIRKNDSQRSYLCPESSGNNKVFIDELEDILLHNDGAPQFSIITGNHDVVRIRRGRSIADLKVAYTFIFTLPGRSSEAHEKIIPETGTFEMISRAGNVTLTHEANSTKLHLDCISAAIIKF